VLDEGVFECLKDGGWHDIKELVRTLNHHEKIVIAVLNFCEKFDFVKIDRRRNKVILDAMIVEMCQIDD